jgi:hypothetical protein
LLRLCLFLRTQRYSHGWQSNACGLKEIAPA